MLSYKGSQLWNRLPNDLINIITSEKVKNLHDLQPCINFLKLHQDIYQVNQKNPPYDFCWYYSNAWEFLYEILHDC